MEEMTILAEPAVDALIEADWRAAPPAMAPSVKAYIDGRWEVYLADAAARRKSLFNGAITRLISLEASVGRVRLTLGPADYKTFLVSTLRDRPWFERNAPEAITRALGNSVLLTSGDQALLGVRSHRVSAYPNRAHVIGGVLEALGTDRYPASVAGILEHLRTELREELDLAPVDSAPRLLFIGRDEFLGQPELVWHWEIREPLEPLIRHRHEEHAAFILVEKSGAELGEQLTPLARYACRLWRGM